MTFRGRLGLKWGVFTCFFFLVRGPSVVGTAFPSSPQLQLRRDLNCWSWQSSRSESAETNISLFVFKLSLCFDFKSLLKCKSMPAVSKSFTLSGSLNCKTLNVLSVSGVILLWSLVAFSQWAQIHPDSHFNGLDVNRRCQIASFLRKSVKFSIMIVLTWFIQWTLDLFFSSNVIQICHHIPINSDVDSSFCNHVINHLWSL